MQRMVTGISGVSVRLSGMYQDEHRVLAGVASITHQLFVDSVKKHFGQFSSFATSENNNITLCVLSLTNLKGQLNESLSKM